MAEVYFSPGFNNIYTVENNLIVGIGSPDMSTYRPVNQKIVRDQNPFLLRSHFYLPEDMFAIIGQTPCRALITGEGAVFIGDRKFTDSGWQPRRSMIDFPVIIRSLRGDQRPTRVIVTNDDVEINRFFSSYWE